MQFGATTNIWIAFNTYEALLWFLLSFGLYLSARHWPASLQTWRRFTALNLFLFGITDLVELYTGGFLHTAPWLLYWKIIHVGGFLLSLWWYVRVRLYDR